MDFPQYRKRFDEKSFYKILNERQMEEVQIIGDKAFKHHITADKYFEIVLLQDILSGNNGIYLSIEENEYAIKEKSISTK